MMVFYTLAQNKAFQRLVCFLRANLSVFTNNQTPLGCPCGEQRISAHYLIFIRYMKLDLATPHGLFFICWTSQVSIFVSHIFVKHQKRKVLKWSCVATKLKPNGQIEILQKSKTCALTRCKQRFRKTAVLLDFQKLKFCFQKLTKSCLGNPRYLEKMQSD